VATLKVSTAAISNSPQHISARRPRRSIAYPLGRLATHLPRPNTTGIIVTIL
jgi:hypothetical protein